MIAPDSGALSEKLDPVLTEALLGKLDADQIEVLSNRLADVAVAEVIEQQRVNLARTIDPSAWASSAVYSSESRAAAKHRALRAADNVLAAVLT